MTDPQLVDLLERGPHRRDESVFDDLRHQVVYDFVLVRESKLDRTARVKGGTLLAATMYQLLGYGNDKVFIADVLEAGPGITRKGHHEGVPVRAGDVALFNMQHVSYRIQERAEKRWLIRSYNIQGRLDTETFEVQPLQDQILVSSGGDSIASPGETVEDRIRKHQSGGMIWLPEDIDTDDVRERHPNRSGMVACYGEVLSVGPGRWRDGDWNQASCKRGDLILFDATYGTLPLTIKGRNYTLVPAGNLAMVADLAPTLPARATA